MALNSPRNQISKPQHVPKFDESQRAHTMQYHASMDYHPVHQMNGKMSCSYSEISNTETRQVFMCKEERNDCVLIRYQLYDTWNINWIRTYLVLGGLSEPPTSAAQTVCCKELPLVFRFVQVKGRNALYECIRRISIIVCIVRRKNTMHTAYHLLHVRQSMKND